MLDAAKWTTINRLVECRYISAVAGAAVVGAVATVAEVKDKMLTGRAEESGMISIAWVLGALTV
jgi:hypothetical protein